MALSLWRGTLADMLRIVKVCLLLPLVCVQAANPFLELEPGALDQWRNEDCVWVHPWAAWCSECVQELPELMPRFAGWKGGRPVIIDLGGPVAQKNFTRKWSALKDSSVPVYLKPVAVPEPSIRKAIASDWDGALPFNILYSRGKELGRWLGKTDFEAIAAVAREKCPPVDSPESQKKPGG